MIILIPSYEPDHRLIHLVQTLTRSAATARVVVVDDGSGPAYAERFREVRGLGADVVTHKHNRGKGVALRTGFAHIEAAYPGEDVVCADSDGQHTPADILTVASRLRSANTDMVLGVRQFTGTVPVRSRVGNAVTRRLFALFSGSDVVDTQTGLRAYPARMLPWLQGVDGDRFEYELKLLIRAAREGLTVSQVPIATIYLDENASSHFRPLQDSLRIYLPMLAFGLSSFASFLVDLGLLTLLVSSTGLLIPSIVIARVVSAACNFTINRCWVFGRAERAPLLPSLLRYAALAGALLAANVMLMTVFVGVGSPLLVAKLLTEGLLFLASFVVQRTTVFARRVVAAAETDAGRRELTPSA